MDNNDIDQIFMGLFTVLPKFSKIMRKFGDRVLKNEEISRTHLRLLRCLKIEGPCSMSNLSKLLDISKPNITPLVDKLLEAGMVIRMSDENDRRLIHIELTNKGEDYIDYIIKNIKTAFGLNLQKLNREDLDLFKETINNMKILVDRLEE